MNNNVLFPTVRLSNSSLIGKRFTVEADPAVKQILTELNTVLGKPAFNEIPAADNNHAEEENRLQEREDEAVEMQKAAEALRKDADDKQKDAIVKRGELNMAQKALKDAQTGGRDKQAKLEAAVRECRVRLRRAEAEMRKDRNELEELEKKLEEAEREATKKQEVEDKEAMKNPLPERIKQLKQQIKQKRDELRKDEQTLKTEEGNLEHAEKQAEDARKQDDSTLSGLSQAAETRSQEYDALYGQFRQLQERAQSGLDEAQYAKMEVQKGRMELLKKKMEYTRKSSGQQFDLVAALKKTLGTKQTQRPVYDPASFLSLADTQTGTLSISECMDKVNELSNLKNSFDQYLDSKWNGLDENEKIVLDNAYSNITDYLVSYGYWVRGITVVETLYDFVTRHDRGAKNIIKYAAISTARSMILKDAREIREVNGKTYNDDDHPLIARIADGGVSLGHNSFTKDIEGLVKGYISSGKEMDIINIGLKALGIDIKTFPKSYYPGIIRSMRNSSIPITEQNIVNFLPIYINKERGDEFEDEEPIGVEEEVQDTDFDVEFLTDEKTYVKTNTANVKCASQLFTSLVMESELDIIGLADYLTHSFSLTRPFNIVDAHLRDTLEEFIYDHKFRYQNKKTGQVERKSRTAPEERQYFYRQVFNWGNSPMPQGVLINTKFPRLWKQLIPVVKEYVENAASSLSSNSFVSKGGVMSLVSALQSNLSAHCSSMACVMSPRIYAEWNFILTRIFSHPEVINQVSPTNPSWKGVVETLYAAAKHKNVDAGLVYTKAELSNAIIREIAYYDPGTFEDDKNFLKFCSKVIELDDTNQSAESFAEEIEQEIKNEYKAVSNGVPKPSTNGKIPQPAGSDEWDY